ncbi:RL11 Family [Baboon cytomegalovirus]|nr:RL11 Family [Baboon cytomegalovirus]
MSLNVCAMINTKHQILCYLYIIRLFVIVSTYTSSSPKIISVKVGDNVTLQNQPLPTEKPFSEAWYVQTQCSRNGVYYISLGSELCTITYLNNAVTSSTACKQLVTYTCERNKLHLYNLSLKTPPSYIFTKLYVSGTRVTHYFRLNITGTTHSTPTQVTQRNTHPTTTPTEWTQMSQHPTHYTTTPHLNSFMVPFSEHSLRLQSSNAATTTPIIVTVSLGTVMIGFCYLYYRYRRQTVL